MKKAFTKITFGATTVLVGLGIALAPAALAAPDPLVPYGTDPTPTVHRGEHFSDHDERDQTNGFVDSAF